MLDAGTPEMFLPLMEKKGTRDTANPNQKRVGIGERVQGDTVAQRWGSAQLER